MSDFERIPTLEEFTINEDVDIPASLSQRYVAVKKQLADKETQKNVLTRQINQRDQEINILQKNINAIEAQAAELQAKSTDTAPAPAAATSGSAKPAAGTTTTTTTTTPTKESKEEDSIEAILLEWEELDNRLFGRTIGDLDDLNPEDVYPEDTEEDFGLGDPNYAAQQDRFSSEDLPSEEYPEDTEEDFGIADPRYSNEDRFNESVDDDDIDIVKSPDEDEKDDGEVETISPDYLFALRLIRPEDSEEIIAKVYRNDDHDFWKVRVVQGDEQPLEKMQFDPEMQMVDIIENLAEIYDEVEEVNVEDYEDMIDDKEENDEKFYGHKAK
jgi:hypothetical protein